MAGVHGGGEGGLGGRSGSGGEHGGTGGAMGGGGGSSGDGQNGGDGGGRGTAGVAGGFRHVTMVDGSTVHVGIHTRQCASPMGESGEGIAGFNPEGRG
eukprot:6931717-Prymnesium_polylepis.2